MNERIKLPAQEWLGYDPEKGDLHGYTFQQMRQFKDLIVKQTIDEVISQMWHHGIDESNNPSFYKVIDKTKEHFGV
jgi:hypothetical protein